MTNEQIQKLRNAGYTEQEIETLLHQIEYRRAYNNSPKQKEYRAEYNQRTYVKENRKAYHKNRNARFARMKEIANNNQ